MSSIELNPSGYTGLTSLTTTSSYPVSNGYTDTSSTTYARFSLSTSTTGYLYYTFDTSDIPETATIQSITAQAKVRVSSTSRVTSTVCQLYTGITAKGSNTTFASTSSTNVVTLSCGTWTRSELSDLRMRIGGTGSSSSQSKYIYFYGATVTITYVTESRTVTVTLSGDGTVSPSGDVTTYDYEEFVVTIIPTDTSATVTATQDGIDITSQLVAHGHESTVTATPESVTTSGIQSGSSYAQYAVGHSAESPYSSTSNMYASQNSTGYAEYSFDFSDIPSTATIEAIEVRCYGYRESSTISSTYVSQCAIYNGSAAVSDTVDFPSTSNSMITLTPNTTISRSQLDNLTVRHYVGYYGGLVLGISFEVSYSTGSGLSHYTYTYTVSGNSVIVVTIGGSVKTDSLYFKSNGSWVQATKVYKKVNNAWVEQTDLTTVFDPNVNYVKG